MVSLKQRRDQTGANTAHRHRERLNRSLRAGGGDVLVGEVQPGARVANLRAGRAARLGRSTT
jgi:hypothetical protein